MLTFVNGFLQPHDNKGIAPANLAPAKKIALNIGIKALFLIYKHYVDVEKLGKPALLKHLKRTLNLKHYTIVKTRKALVVRGAVLNSRKLKVLYTKSPSALADWFNINTGVSLDTYEGFFT